MKKIEFYAGQDLDKAYQDLQINAPCCGEFNGKVLYSTDTIDEIYAKVLGTSKWEYEDIYVRNMRNTRERKLNLRLKFLN